AAHRRLFSGVPDDEYRERLAHIALLDQVFERVCAEALTEEALEAQVEASRLDWLLVDLERLPFTEASMVRETRLCCREDTLTLAQLAARINRLVVREQVRLEECELEMRRMLLSAEPGELLGPLAVDDQFHALEVRAKYLPDTQDPEVRELAESAVVSALEQRARVLHVRWHGRL
ncbi:MAG TPA: hypothetical protein VM032_01325, partial [Vicinamibacterales bacterium]|nr:hypothetical protein [Vicinamibacterales bacterium]